MKALNRRFRGVNQVTDVLSFPADRKGEGGEGRGKKYFGDIVIARGMARKQARNIGHSAAIEVRVLALHGLLHLLGYDHQVDNGQMARVEARLRRKGGLPLGLIARSS
jgi:probable rRNA maturation factor